MIFYFSGTGNSLYIARTMADCHSQTLVSIAGAINSGAEAYKYTLEDGEIIGFVFPVYAWGPPGIVLEFIQKLKLNRYQGNYLFSVVTCGENVGNVMNVLAAGLEQQGYKLHSGFSVRMPNNYILLGDVDKKELEKQKLAEAEKTLEQVNHTVDRKQEGLFELEKGCFPWLLTGVFYPLFHKRSIDTGKFHADDRCNSCGTCEAACNCQNIKVQGKPRWGNRCVQCLACIHHCPTRAIQYGKMTRKKGRYINPNYFNK